MSDFLKKIRALTVARVAAAKTRRPVIEPCARVAHDFAARLSSGPEPRIIAEVKRASPSAGAIALELNPVHVARQYFAEGAAVISVLTEPTYFGGSVQTLADIRKALPEAVLLMKDFVIDSYQLLQAQEAGADAVLLMISLLSTQEFAELFNRTRELGLTPLVEVHDMEELELALAIGAPVIGVNNRNLHTLEVSLEISRHLSLRKPSNTVFISESGISSREDIRELTSLGFDGFLIGSALMKEQRPGAALRALLCNPLEIKICGITRVEDAALASQLGATMIGLVFAESSPRQVSLATAKEIVRALPDGVKAIGVFVSEEAVMEAIQVAGLHGVQFHNFEPTSMLVTRLRGTGVLSIRAFSVDKDLKAKDIEASGCELVLLDVPRESRRAPLDADFVKALRLTRRFLIAGGLNAENIGTYLQELRPSGVDIASGVEASVGVKSHDKLRQLFANCFAMNPQTESGCL